MGFDASIRRFKYRIDEREIVAGNSEITETNFEIVKQVLVGVQKTHINAQRERHETIKRIL